jgi:hypothetical protein
VGNYKILKIKIYLNIFVPLVSKACHIREENRLSFKTWWSEEYLDKKGRRWKRSVD